jgi:hypothetical protein
MDEGSDHRVHFTYERSKRIAEREAAGPPKVAAAAANRHANSVIGRLNAKVGLRITLIVGTMWCAYLFAIIALIALPSAINSGSVLEIVIWLSSSFLQLVLLPIIIVGQNIQAAAADARAEATYKDAAAVLEEAKQIQLHLQAQDDRISDILQHLEILVGARPAST